MIEAIGFEPVFFLGDKSTFRQTLVVTDVWKTSATTRSFIWRRSPH